MNGYLTDVTCPTDRSHGDTLYYTSGRHCPHEQHYFPVISKNYWSHREFDELKRTDDQPALIVKPHRRARKAKRAKV